MRASTYKRKYPKLWKSIRTSMKSSLLGLNDFKFNLTKKQMNIIAHNAAFYACDTHHQMESAKWAGL